MPNFPFGLTYRELFDILQSVDISGYLLKLLYSESDFTKDIAY